MQDEDKSKDNAHSYPTGKFTLLEFMMALAVLGVLLSWVLQRFFLS